MSVPVEVERTRQVGKTSIRNRCRLRRPGGTEDGFGLLEIIVALTLFAVVILAADSGSVVASSAATQAKQRAVAEGLVASDLASLQALSFSDIQLGLNTSDSTLATDPNVTVSGSTYTLKLTGATLLSANTKSSDGPLVPHLSTSSIRGTTYTVGTYPSSAASGLVDVVVIVTWKAEWGTTDKVVGEIKVAAP